MLIGSAVYLKLEKSMLRKSQVESVQNILLFTLKIRLYNSYYIMIIWVIQLYSYKMYILDQSNQKIFNPHTDIFSRIFFQN